MAKKEPYKLCLRINLYGNCKLEIKIFMITHNFIKGMSNKVSYYDFDNEFYIYSKDNFLFDDDILRLPSSEFLDKDLCYIHTFETEHHRYEYLKHMYYALSNWGSDKEIFVTNYSIIDKKLKNRSNVNLCDNYWFIS